MGMNLVRENGRETEVFVDTSLGITDFSSCQCSSMRRGIPVPTPRSLERCGRSLNRSKTKENKLFALSSGHANHAGSPLSLIVAPDVLHSFY